MHAQRFDVVGVDRAAPPSAERFLRGYLGEPLERGVHEHTVVFDVDFADADRALGDQRAPARLALEHRVVDDPDDDPLHVGMLEEVPKRECLGVPTVEVVANAGAYLDLPAAGLLALQEGVADRGMVVRMHPISHAGREVPSAAESGAQPEVAEHDAGPEVGAEDRDGVGERAKDVRVPDVERQRRRADRRDDFRHPDHPATSAPWAPPLIACAI